MAMTSRTAARITGGILLVAFLAMLVLVVNSPDKFIYDESYYVEYVSLLHRYGFTEKFLKSLTGFAGPLYAVFQLLFEPLTKLRPVAMRFVNVFTLVVLTSVLARRLRREGGHYWVAACSVLVVPMTWVMSGLALTEMPAMLFVTLSLYLQLRGLDALEIGGSVLPWFLTSGVCLGVAVWGRQPYLLLAGVPILLGIIERRLRLPAAAFLCAAGCLVAPLFVIWGGLLPTSSAKSPVERFSFIHGLTSFAYAGICVLLLGARSRRLPLKTALGLIVLTFIVNGYLGAIELYPFFEILHRHLPPSLMYAIGNLSGSLFVSFGVVFLAVLLRVIWETRTDLRRLTENVGLLCAVGAPAFIGHQFSSRYTAMSLPWLILASQPWRRWTAETAISAALGCGLGVLSLYGYFHQ
jgi:hypothetical protein